MFLKKESLSEEELKQKRIDLDASLKHAAELKQNIINTRAQKLKEHSEKVDSIRVASKNKASCLHVIESVKEKNFDLHKQFLNEISMLEDLEKFQIFMMQKEAILKATDFVTFIEKRCPSESIDAIKNRSKIFMSIALLANYPNEVMPNADLEETQVLIQAKNFYDSINSLFSKFSEFSAEKHQNLSWNWIKTIHIFDEWMIKDKTVLFEKMKTDFLTWTKTIGNISVDDPSRAEWETSAVKYQNEILKKIHAIFGPVNMEILSKEIDAINSNFNGSRLSMQFNSKTKNYQCQWIYENRENNPTIIAPNNQNNLGVFEKLKSTNIELLHEIMLKENDFDFDSIMKLSGKSIDEISNSNKETLSNLISILSVESDGKLIAESLQNLFDFICSSLVELAGDNIDYCEEIKLVDCSVDSKDWVSDSLAMLKWSLSMCKRCCAPARDQICKQLDECIESLDMTESPEKMIELFTDALASFLNLVNLMRRDYCNFRLKSLVAQIDGKGIAEQYELEKLKIKFNSSYEKTKEWLLSPAVKDYKPLETLIDSYLRILDPFQEDILESNAPETFYLDIDRLRRYRDELSIFLKKEAAIIYIKNNANTKNASFKIDARLSDLSKCLASVHKEIDVKQILEREVKDIPNNTLLSGNIIRLFDDTLNDKVFLLLKQRELLKIRTILMSGANVQTDSLKGKICGLFRYNRSCFSSVYDNILAKN